MTLSPGAKVGPYEVTSQIGVGGMGEVYCATDTNLKRQVAIKVLPESLAGDAERLTRFQREAELLAQLNHANIAQIHGLERADGHIALVMELVEGPTLADRIARGPIALDEALPIAKQIAEALEAAHERGIIHRDLKPANIKLRDDGTVKVLDFGLAKAMDQGSGVGDQGSGEAANSPTITTPAMTMQGVILGTAAYMAPEQAKGRSADKRVDIWAFGVVVYEMLTGKRLFDGDGLTEVLAAVVRMDPDLSVVPAKTRRLLRKCLERDPRRRLRDIGDWQDLLDDDARAVAPVVPPASSAGRLLAAVAAVATILLATVSLVHFRETAPELPPTRTSLLPPSEATWEVTSQALSPDGRRLAFEATGNDNRRLIFVRSLDVLEAKPLAGTEGGEQPFWSPEGDSLAFFARGKLHRIDVAGGLATALADVRGTARGGTWGLDGTIVYAASNLSGLTKIAAAAGTPAAATTLGSGETSHRWPWFLPDGRHFLFADGRPGPGNPMDVWIASIDSPERRKLFTANSAAGFASGPDGRGYLLYMRESTLVAQPFDTRSLQTTAVATPVAERVAVSNAARGAFSVSGNGVLSFAATAEADELAWLDRTGNLLGSLGGLDRVTASFRLSPDGRTLAYESRDDIWLYDVERQVRSRFTTDAGRDSTPLWSPDGRTIYFASRRNGGENLYRKPASGVGSEEEIATNANLGNGSISPDGRFLAFVRAQRSRQIWVLPDPGGPPGKTQPYKLFQEQSTGYRPEWSPDGRWLAFVSADGGSIEVYAAPFPGPGPRVRISTTGVGGSGSESIRVSPDGKQILFVDAGQRLVAVDVAAAGGQLQVGASHILFPLAGEFDVSPDGRRFLASVRHGNVPLTLVQQWTAMLGK